MKELKILLMLERGGGRASQVGEGRVDLMPALQQPSRSFVRSVDLRSDLGGSAKIYVSFRLSECCPSNEPPVVDEALEVGIGRLQLNNANLPPDATHLYVEYSLLGHCGSQLETDSVPKGEVMQFNHTKRLKVNNENAAKLEPLLKSPDTQPLMFQLVAEPCDLSDATDVRPLGHAEVNLLQDMVQRDQDIISKEVPVYNNQGQLVGKLSITIIGISTLRNRMPR